MILVFINSPHHCQFSSSFACNIAFQVFNRLNEMCRVLIHHLLLVIFLLIGRLICILFLLWGSFSCFPVSLVPSSVPGCLESRLGCGRAVPGGLSGPGLGRITRVQLIKSFLPVPAPSQHQARISPGLASWPGERKQGPQHWGPWLASVAPGLS